jgi:hypothetical protein
MKVSKLNVILNRERLCLDMTGLLSGVEIASDILCESLSAVHAFGIDAGNEPLDTLRRSTSFTLSWTQAKGEETSQPRLIYRDQEQPNYGSK